MIRIFYMDIGCNCEEEQLRIFYEILPKERQEQADRLSNRELAKKLKDAGEITIYASEKQNGNDIDHNSEN